MNALEVRMSMKQLRELSWDLQIAINNQAESEKIERIADNIASIAEKISREYLAAHPEVKP